MGSILGLALPINKAILGEVLFKQTLTDIHGAHTFTQPVGKESSVSSEQGAGFLEAGGCLGTERALPCRAPRPEMWVGGRPKVCVTRSPSLSNRSLTTERKPPDFKQRWRAAELRPI